jgi:HSP20 family molecular chaperone IbpA
MFRQSFYTPWQEIERMQREMDRVFSNFYASPRARRKPSFPAINVWTIRNAVFTAELPGLT